MLYFWILTVILFALPVGLVMLTWDRSQADARECVIRWQIIASALYFLATGPTSQGGETALLMMLLGALIAATALLDYGRILHACKLVCRFHHRMIENMVELIAEKNLTLVEKLEVVSRTTIREKLLTYLARQAEAAGARTFTIPMGRTALAEYLCTDRSAMTRELARMRDEGLIDYTKRTFTLRQ